MIHPAPATDPDQVAVMREATAAELDASRRALDRALDARAREPQNPKLLADFNDARRDVFDRLAVSDEWA